MDRRNFLVAGATAVAASMFEAQAASGAAQSTTGNGAANASPDLELTIQPARVFKRSGDRNRLRLEQWVFVLVLLAPVPVKPRFERMTVAYRTRGGWARKTEYSAAELAALDLLPAPSIAPGGNAHRVAAFEIVDAMPLAMATERARCEFAWRDAEGASRELAVEIPLETYAQRTELVFPFKGKGMITQGGSWNDGHRNRSGMFAIDAIGLTHLYAPMTGEGDDPDVVAGWERPIIAPAAGLVVVVRNDRPDQPVTGVSDPKYFVPEHPQGGDPGNHCVIDHGYGEFSMLAHFREGSLRVREGERVEQGQRLGLLGNSGDTNTPHVHHQLQSGAQWTTADALPHAYVNGPEGQHDRGTIFDAK